MKDPTVKPTALRRLRRGCEALRLKGWGARFTWLVALVLIALGGCGQKRDRPPSVRRLALYNKRAALDFTLRHRNENRDPQTDTGGKERFEETIFEEKIDFHADGYVYHPTLLEFSIGVLLGLQQADFEQLSGGKWTKSGSSGEIVEFDISGTFLQKKPYPTSFFARRGRSLTPRPFRSTVEALSTGYGFTWQWVDEKTPVRLQYNYNEVDLDPFVTAGERPGRRENSALQFEMSYIFSKHNKLEFFFEHETIEEEPLDFRYDVAEIRLRHDYHFGKEHQHRLQSEIKRLRQRGTVDNERTSWVENLSLVHSDRLRTGYQIEWSDRSQASAFESGGVDERSYQGTVTLDHRLYDNLETHVNAYFQKQNFDSGLEIERSGGGVGFRYYRHNPWGLLRANYSLRTDRLSLRGGDQSFEVIEEERTFNDPEPIILTDPNIQIGSITILREDRTELYRVGRDFRMWRIGDRIELERIATGGIVNGETVLVSYRFQIGGSYVQDTFVKVFGIQQEFDFGLKPYFRWLRQEQTVRPGDASGVTPEDINSRVFGIEFERKALRLTAEFEDYDSSVSPFVVLRVGGGYSRSFASGRHASVGVHWSDLEFKGDRKRTTRLFNVEGRYQIPLSPRTMLETAIVYRNEEDSLSGDDEGIELDLSLEWSFRKTEVRLEYEYATFRDVFTDQDSSTLFIRVRRSF